MREKRAMAWVGAGASAALAVLACGSSESTGGGITGTGGNVSAGSSGAAGTAGTAGKAGAGGSAQCKTDADCTAKLPATEPTGCAEAKCLAQGTCVFRAKDADSDGHPAKDCKSKAAGTIEAGDDCNDLDPNVFPGAQKTPCSVGVGECKRDGYKTCGATGVVCSATPGAPAPDDSPCDGKDYNCDGNPKSSPCACKDGEVLKCNTGKCNEKEVTCKAGQFPCDPPQEKVVYREEKDGDGFCGSASQEACAAPTGYKPESLCTGGVDCNDSDPKVFPGAAESCGDAVDRDCDGNNDNGFEDIGAVCKAHPGKDGVGTCKAGVMACAGETGKTCEGYVDPQTEGCGPMAADTNCDGIRGNDPSCFVTIYSLAPQAISSPTCNQPPTDVMPSSVSNEAGWHSFASVKLFKDHCSGCDLQVSRCNGPNGHRLVVVQAPVTNPCATSDWHEAIMGYLSPTGGQGYLEACLIYFAKNTGKTIRLIGMYAEAPQNPWHKWCAGCGKDNYPECTPDLDGNVDPAQPFQRGYLPP